MYFWKVDKLIEDFKSNSVSQKDELKYLLIYFILMAVFSDRFFSLGSDYNIYDFLSTVSLVAVTFWGIWHCYKANSSGDNTDFITRMMCIGFPVIVRVVAVALPLGLLIGVIHGLFLVDGISEEELYSEYPSDVFDVILIGIIGIAYYIYLASKIKAVSKTNS